VRYLARGFSSIDIAAELSLSPHTVRDHVKAILRKCGASSRGELVAQLFADRLKPALHRSTVESV
jgi:DNA-binding NarL/FixJ family response regulator